MKSFKYKIYQNNILILINYISRETKEEAYNDLKKEFEGATVELMEVTPASRWKC